MYRRKVTTVKVDRETLERLKSYVLSRHGKLRGYLQQEVQKAINYYLDRAMQQQQQQDLHYISRYTNYIMDPRVHKTVQAIIEHCRLEGLLEKPLSILAWEKIIGRVLEEIWGRKPDHRTIRKYIHILKKYGYLRRQTREGLEVWLLYRATTV
jgi:hypothetical protein